MISQCFTLSEMFVMINKMSTIRSILTHHRPTWMTRWCSLCRLRSMLSQRCSTQGCWCFGQSEASSSFRCTRPATNRHFGTSAHRSDLQHEAYMVQLCVLLFQHSKYGVRKVIYYKVTQPEEDGPAWFAKRRFH